MSGSFRMVSLGSAAIAVLGFLGIGGIAAVAQSPAPLSFSHTDTAACGDGASIRILATDRTTETGRGRVKQTIEAVCGAMKPEVQTLFDGYEIILTNGEEDPLAYEKLNDLRGQSIDWAWRQGGSNIHYSWVSEEMICSTGVPWRDRWQAAGFKCRKDPATPGQAVADPNGPDWCPQNCAPDPTRPGHYQEKLDVDGTDLCEKDETRRKLDQVVHEFAHHIAEAVAYRGENCGSDKLVDCVPSALEAANVDNSYGDIPPVEWFPWVVQGLFDTAQGVSAYSLDTYREQPRTMALLGAVFQFEGTGEATRLKLSPSHPLPQCP